MNYLNNTESVWLIICSESSEVISFVVAIGTITSWCIYICLRNSSLSGSILRVNLRGQPLARIALELFGERNGC